MHPSWHATGIVKAYEAKLASVGIKMDPASNVSDAVVEQVLAARSGRIFMPRRVEGQSKLREWPRWAQDSVGYLNAKINGTLKL